MDNDLIERLRLLERDHEPDGWPAVRMRDITALLDALEAARADACVALVADIRWACGDKGKRMQPELVEYVRELARDAARYRWLRDVWGRQIAIIGTSDCTFGVSTPSWRGAWLNFDAAIDAVMAPAIAAQQAEGE